MGKLLLDEMFFYRDNTDGYIDELIKFIGEYFEDDIVLFHPYCSLNNLWMLNNRMASTEKKVIKSGKFSICDLNEVDKCIVQKNISFGKYSDDFSKRIKYTYETFVDAIIFNAPENHIMQETRPCEHVYLINHIRKEINSNIAYFITKGIFMKNIIEPTLSSPLPNTDLCRDYLDLLRKKCSKERTDVRIPIYIEVGTEVVRRNKYLYNSRVSDINSNSGIIRNIFNVYLGNNSIYASIDIENGAIEIFNHRGKHQDEYTYNNKRQNKQDKSGKHDIKV